MFVFTEIVQLIVVFIATSSVSATLPSNTGTIGHLGWHVCTFVAFRIDMLFCDELSVWHFCELDFKTLNWLEKNQNQIKNIHESAEYLKK